MCLLRVCTYAGRRRVEEDTTANNAVIYVREPRHAFIKRCISHFVDNYRGSWWGKNGPVAISEALRG